MIQLTTDEAIRICEPRRVLEPRVMEWAAERTRESAIRELSFQFATLAEAARRRDLAAFFQENIFFHQLIWDEAHPIVLGSELAKRERLLAAIRDHEIQRAALALLEIAADSKSTSSGDPIQCALRKLRARSQRIVSDVAQANFLFNEASTIQSKLQAGFRLCFLPQRTYTKHRQN